MPVSILWFRSANSGTKDLLKFFYLLVADALPLVAQLHLADAIRETKFLLDNS